jgi:hypothetical protein
VAETPQRVAAPAPAPTPLRHVPTTVVELPTLAGQLDDDETDDAATPVIAAPAPGSAAATVEGWSGAQCRAVLLAAVQSGYVAEGFLQYFEGVAIEAEQHDAEARRR